MNVYCGDLDPPTPTSHVPTSEVVRNLKDSAHLASLHRSIAEGQLSVVVLDAENDWREVTFPLAFWSDTVSGGVSLVRGRLEYVAEEAIPGTPVRLKGQPVCFRAGELQRWYSRLRSVVTEGTKGTFAQASLRDAFHAWAKRLHVAGHLITEKAALTEMRGEVSESVTRQSVRDLLKTLEPGWRAPRGRLPNKSRQS